MAVPEHGSVTRSNSASHGLRNKWERLDIGMLLRLTEPRSGR